MWYRASGWRNLIDMHIPDWNPDFLSEFSPDAYAQAMADAHVDTAIIYAGNCLGMCFWPTPVGHMHAGLNGRDINAQTIEALRARDINVVVYFNIWNRWAHDAHPSWRMLTADGRSTLENADGSPSRFGQCCLNSAGYRAFVEAQITDLCRRFGAQASGLWIDMIGYFGTVCVCGSCRDRYLAEAGREIPKRIDWNDPEWVRFIRRREAWLDDFTGMVQSAALAINPDLSLAFQSTSLLSGWGGGVTQSFLDKSDYLAGDFYGPPLQYSVICKYLNNLTRNRPMEFMTSRCYELTYHTATKPDSELENSALGAFAHNAAFVFIDAIDPVGTIDRRFYRRMGALYERIAPHRRAVAPDAALVSDVAFYQNLASAYDPRQNGTPLKGAHTSYPVVPGMENIGLAMVGAHILFDFIGEPQLGALRCYPVVVLTSQYVLSGAEAEALRRYVENGGSLVVTGETGLNDPAGNRLDDFALADVLGVHYAGITDEDRTYIAPTPLGQPHFDENDAQYPLGLASGQIIVRAEPDVQVLATVTPAYSSSDEIHAFGSAISNPPAQPTNHPAVTVRAYGRGRALYIASALETETLRPHRRAFAALIAHMCAPRLKTNAPEWLEVIVFCDPAERRYQLSLNNIARDARGLIARDIALDMAMPECAHAVWEVESGRAIPFVQSNGRIQIAIDELCDFAMLMIDYR